MAYLRANGEAAEIVRRPDRERGHGRAVDAELLVAGRLVGVEVTQSIHAARALREIGRLQEAVASALESSVVSWPPGSVGVSVLFGALPSRRDMGRAAPILTREIARAIGTIDTHSESVERSIDSTVDFVRRLDLTYRRTGRRAFGWITSAAEWTARVDPVVAALADRLLDAKARQTRPCEEAWIVIVDQDRMARVGDLAAALRRREEEIPPNWTRVWVLPPWDDASVELAWSR